MRVILGHRVARDARRLDVRAVGSKALLFHVPDNAAMHGLEPVAHVGQRARHDDRHRVVEEAALHLVLQLNGLGLVVALGVGGGCWCVAHAVPFILKVQVSYVAGVGSDELFAQVDVVTHQHAGRSLGERGLVD